MKSEMNMIISTKPNIPSSMKLTAQGYMNMTSTSKSTNRIATIRYLMENGILELPCGSIPHSKVSSLTSDFLCGPSRWVTKMVVSTKPTATTNMIAIGK